MIATTNPEVTKILFQKSKTQQGPLTQSWGISIRKRTHEAMQRHMAKPVHSGFGVCFLFSPARRKSSLLTYLKNKNI